MGRRGGKLICDGIKALLGDIKGTVLTSASVVRAISYTQALWRELTRALDNDAIALDNNAVERSLRGVALGLKNHWGSRSERGTRVAAICYSLIESAKLCGVDPAAYLREVALRSIRDPGRPTVLLPHQFAAEHAAHA